jgi:O-antigen ligase
LIGVIFSGYKLISSAYCLMMVMCICSAAIAYEEAGEISFETFKRVLFAVSIIVFLIGIIQYLSPWFSIPGKWVDSNEYNLKKRIYSTFFNPNVFGFYINFIILLSCGNLSFKKLNFETTIFFAGVVCLYLTFSRTAWVSLITSMAVMGLFNRKYLKYAAIISVFLMGTDFLMGIGRIDPSKATGDSSILYRIEIWKACIKAIKSHPFFGIGFGTLFKHITEYSSVVKPNIEHCHNIYLQVMTETGAAGFLIFTAAFFRTAKKILNNIKKCRNNETWITALSILIMVMIHGLVDSVFFTPQILMILCIYVGTLMSINDSECRIMK